MAWDPKDVTEVDHRQAQSPSGHSPLPSHGVRLGAAHSEDPGRFFNGQELWEAGRLDWIRSWSTQQNRIVADSPQKC